MKLLPNREIWKRWDWATRFGVVTGIASLTISVIVTLFGLFGVDIWEETQKSFQEVIYKEPDPWKTVNLAKIALQYESIIVTGKEIIGRFNSTDISDALSYHQKYAERRCYEDKIYLDLMKTRFVIAQFLYHREDNPYANAAYNKHPDLQDFLRNERITKLFATFKYLTSGDSRVDIREDIDLKLFSKVLLEYYRKVTNTRDWQEKFQNLHSDHLDSYWREGLYQPYVEAGFPPSPDYCMNSYSFSFSLDTYMYSFWWRRWNEGTMLPAKIVLENFDHLRIFPIEKIP